MKQLAGRNAEKRDLTLRVEEELRKTLEQLHKANEECEMLRADQRSTQKVLLEKEDLEEHLGSVLNEMEPLQRICARLETELSDKRTETVALENSLRLAEVSLWAAESENAMKDERMEALEAEKLDLEEHLTRVLNEIEPLVDQISGLRGGSNAAGCRALMNAMQLWTQGSVRGFVRNWRANTQTAEASTLHDTIACLRKELNAALEAGSTRAEVIEKLQEQVETMLRSDKQGKDKMRLSENVEMAAKEEEVLMLLSSVDRLRSANEDLERKLHSQLSMCHLAVRTGADLEALLRAKMQILAQFEEEVWRLDTASTVSSPHSPSAALRSPSNAMRSPSMERHEVLRVRLIPALANAWHPPALERVLAERLQAEPSHVSVRRAEDGVALTAELMESTTQPLVLLALAARQLQGETLDGCEVIGCEIDEAVVKMGELALAQREVLVLRALAEHRAAQQASMTTLKSAQKAAEEAAETRERELYALKEV